VVFFNNYKEVAIASSQILYNSTFINHSTIRCYAVCLTGSVVQQTHICVLRPKTELPWVVRTTALQTFLHWRVLQEQGLISSFVAFKPPSLYSPHFTLRWS